MRRRGTCPAPLPFVSQDATNNASLRLIHHSSRRVVREERAMRRFIIGLAGLLASSDAFAADYLRGGMYENGPAASYDWSGIYVGAQAGYATADMGYKGSLDALVQD